MAQWEPRVGASLKDLRSRVVVCFRDIKNRIRDMHYPHKGHVVEPGRFHVMAAAEPCLDSPRLADCRDAAADVARVGRGGGCWWSRGRGGWMNENALTVEME